MAAGNKVLQEIECFKSHLGTDYRLVTPVSFPLFGVVYGAGIQKIGVVGT